MVLSDGEKMVFAAAFAQAGLNNPKEGKALAKWCVEQGTRAVLALRLFTEVMDGADKTTSSMVKSMLGDNQ